jgi:Leucine-rich repeat (LRR) protein
MKNLFALISMLLIFASWQRVEEHLELTTLEKKGYFEDLSRAKQHVSLVKYLNLKYQNLTEIPSEVFELPNLEHLDLAHNQIGVVSNRLIELPKLKELYLNSNNISELPLNFKELNIKLLYIQNNPINDLPHIQSFLPSSIVELKSGNRDKNEAKSEPTIQPKDPLQIKR